MKNPPSLRTLLSTASILLLAQNLSPAATTLEVSGYFEIDFGPIQTESGLPPGQPSPFIANQGVNTFDGFWGFNVEKPTVFTPDSIGGSTMTLTGALDFFSLSQVDSDPFLTTIDSLTFDTLNTLYDLVFDDLLNVTGISVYSSETIVSPSGVAEDDFFLFYNDEIITGNGPVYDVLTNAEISSASQSSSYQPADRINSGNLGLAQGSYTIVPEPSCSLLLLGGAMVGLALRRRV